jgi:hypothetical protein
MRADGLSHGGKITLKRGMPEAETFSILCHELGHELLHRGDRRKDTSVVVRETEAEAVAFVVCSSLGLATNDAAVTTSISTTGMLTCSWRVSASFRKQPERY